MLNFNINIPWNVVMIVVWIAVIAIGIIVEAQTSELVSIWFAISGAVAIVCAIAQLSIPIQIAVFSTLTLLLVICTRPLVKKLNKGKSENSTVESMIGEKVVVTKEIKVGETGEIKAKYDKYTAIAPCETTNIPIDTLCVIKEIRGNKVIVERL